MTVAAALALVGAAASVPPPRTLPHDPLPHDKGPPPGHTGGFGEPTCHVCHFGSDLNAFGGSVGIEGLPDGYTPGEPYLLTVVLHADETALAGFQLSAREADGVLAGRQAGSFRAIDGRVSVTSAEGGAQYAHQTEDGARVADSRGSSWTLEWTAPRTATRVALHLAANSGNGDNSPFSDLVYVTEIFLSVDGAATGSPRR